MISLSLLEENDFSKIVAWNRNKPIQKLKMTLRLFLLYHKA